MSDRTNLLFAAVIKRIGNLPGLDWEEIAMESGYKDGKNAKVMFGRHKDKLIKGATAPSTPISGTKSTHSKKRAVEESPSASKRARSNKAVQSIEHDDDEEMKPAFKQAEQEVFRVKQETYSENGDFEDHEEDLEDAV